MDFLLGISPFLSSSPFHKLRSTCAGLIDFRCARVSVLPSSFHSGSGLSWPGAGCCLPGAFRAHQPPLVWRRPVSSGEGGRDVYTPGQSPKEQADQVSPHTLDLPQLHPKILSACKSGYCLHKSSFCLPSPPARRYRPGQSRG